jgi:hypothetical protein
MVGGIMQGQLPAAAASTEAEAAAIIGAGVAGEAAAVERQAAGSSSGSGQHSSSSSSSSGRSRLRAVRVMTTVGGKMLMEMIMLQMTGSSCKQHWGFILEFQGMMETSQMKQQGSGIRKLATAVLQMRQSSAHQMALERVARHVARLALYYVCCCAVYAPDLLLRVTPLAVPHRQPIMRCTTLHAARTRRVLLY